MELFLPEFDWNVPTILFAGFALFAFLQLLMVLFFYSRIAFMRETRNDESPSKGVSVILAARNEAENLLQNLPLLLEQDHPNFEVIVVNHQSTDDTFYLLNAMQR
jgi:cellulose synthase/poly-beta-1,6-N-acetylglucosamine synthase-like glycosyltransferase